MIAPLAKSLDWSAIQAVTLMTPAQSDNPRLEEAIEFLKIPDFVSADSQPAQVEFNGPLDFHFRTPLPSEFMENNVVHGRFYRCRERWQERSFLTEACRPTWQHPPNFHRRPSTRLSFPPVTQSCGQRSTGRRQGL